MAANTRTLETDAKHWGQNNLAAEIDSCMVADTCEQNRYAFCDDPNYSFLGKVFTNPRNFCTGNVVHQSRIHLSGTNPVRPDGVFLNVGFRLERLDPLVSQIGCN